MRVFRIRPTSWFVVLGLILIGLLWLRHEARGFRNVLSPGYWSDRLSGRLLYDPLNHYLRHGDPGRPEVALTFDDGPHPESANLILDILKEKGIKATFFLVGKRIKEHPEIVRRMIAEGHVVGNHTQDHLRLVDLKPAQIETELENCEKNFERAVPGHRMELFRPPGMRFNAEVVKLAGERGCTMVGWSEAAQDFISTSHRHPDPNLVRTHIVEQVENGSIILLHDIPTTAQVLSSALDEIAQKGYRFVTVPQMLDRLERK